MVARERKEVAIFFVSKHQHNTTQHGAGMLHFRHPYEIGGAYWLFDMAYTQVSVIIVLSIASATRELWIIVIALAGSWLVAIISLLAFSESGFKHTFYRPTRVWEYNRALFDTGVDEYRMNIFTDHREYYRWYEDLVKEWLADIWNDVHSKKPAWLTEDAIRKIPLDLIPNINHLGVQGEMDEEDLLELEQKERGRGSARATLGRVARTTLRIHGHVGSLGVQTVTSTNDGGAGPTEDIARQIADSVVAELAATEGGYQR